MGRRAAQAASIGRRVGHDHPVRAAVDRAAQEIVKSLAVEVGRDLDQDRPRLPNVQPGVASVGILHRSENRG
jgi:hypothetical protein